MKKLLVLLSSLIGLLFTITFVAVLYLVNLDPNNHKEWISSKFLKQTGRNLSLEGEIGLSIYPWFGLELNQITVSNAPGFGSEPMFYADQAHVRIKLMPILDEQYEIDTVLLLGSDINLSVNELGQNNWDSLLSVDENVAVETSNTETFPLSNIALGGVDIQNASLSYDDQQTNQHLEINNFTMSTGKLLYGEPVQLNTHFDITSSQPELSADVEFSGTVIYDLDKQQYEISPLRLSSQISGANIPTGSAELSLSSNLSIDLAQGLLALDNIEFDALGTHLSASISGSKIQTSTPALQADINLTGDDLAMLFRVAEINDIATQIESINSRDFSVVTSLSTDLATGDLSLSKLSANLLGASIEGNIVATNIQSATPGIQGQLNAAGPDLPTLLGVIGQIQGGSDTPLSQYGRQLAQVSNKSFSINADFDADLSSGNISAPILNAELLGFTLDGSLNAHNMNDDAGSVNGQLNLSGNNLGEVLSALEQDAIADIAQSLNLNLGISGNRNNLTLNPFDLNLVLAGDDIPNSPVNVALLASSTINLNNDSLAVQSFSLKGLGLDASGGINVSNLSTQPSYNGNIGLSPFNLRTLLNQLNIKIPVTSDANTLQNFALDSAFSGTASNIQISSFSATLDESTIGGNVSVTDFENPAITFSLNVDQINADRYLAPSTETENTNAPEPADLPLESVRALNTQGDFAIGSLNISGLSINDFAMTLNAKNGLVNLSPIQAKLYEGTYAGSILLDASLNTPSLSMETSLQNITIEPLMTDFIDASYVSGLGSIDFSLTGVGANISSIKQNLNGTGSVALQNGILQGVDVASVLAQVETIIRSQKLSDIQQGEETAFNNISASIGINQGNVRSDDLLIEAPGFQVTGQGTLVNLRNDSINYKLLTSVVQGTATTNDQEYDIGGYSLPIACTGTINSPKCLPDVGEIVANALKQAVTQGLGNLLQRALGVEGGIKESAVEKDETPAPSNVTTEEPVEEESIESQLLNRALDSLFR